MLLSNALENALHAAVRCREAGHEAFIETSGHDAWLMKWLPARAYDNAVYVVFSNPIGRDYNEIKNGCSMILDPFGDIVAECRKLGDDFVIATAIPEKLRQAGGYRYRNARRPELYADIIGQPHESNQKVAWLTETTNSK